MEMYRYEDKLYSSGDEDIGYSTYINVILQKFKVIRETPKGKWIEQYPGHNRFVLNHARKRFAHDTVEEARNSFILRKLSQIRILETRIRYIRTALRQIGHLL